MMPPSFGSERSIMARAASALNSSEEMVVRVPLRGSQSETLLPSIPVTAMEWR
ncbi:hypothetical protein D3C72_2350600 [compost metagenome]